MDTNVSCNVTDLFGRDKEALEHLLGTPLSQTQQVYIVAFTPGKEPEPSVRLQAAKNIEAVLDKSAAYAKAHQVTDAQIDEAVDEAMNHARQRKGK